MQQVQYIKIGNIISNPNNPRTLKDERFNKLVQSLVDFPEMLEKRPLICVTTASGKYMVLGGNQRLKAATKAGIKQLPVMLADDWSEEKRQEFIIKDNIGFGDWDWELLKTDWNEGQLIEWGLDELTNDPFNDDNTPFESSETTTSGAPPENNYSRKIVAPIYEPKGDKPQLSDLYDKEAFDRLISEIDKKDLPKDEKEFLRLCAYRHVIFNYENIANYYAHSEKDTQELMENSALVIIDFDKAIERGFTRLSEAVIEQYRKDYADGSNDQ